MSNSYVCNGLMAMWAFRNSTIPLIALNLQITFLSHLHRKLNFRCQLKRRQITFFGSAADTKFKNQLFPRYLNYLLILLLQLVFYFCWPTCIGFVLQRTTLSPDYEGQKRPWPRDPQDSNIKTAISVTVWSYKSINYIYIYL